MNDAQLIQMQQQNAALQQRVIQLQTILQQRAVPHVATLVDGLNGLANSARAGDPSARQLLGEFAEALEGARQSRIVVANGHVPKA